MIILQGGYIISQLQHYVPGICHPSRWSLLMRSMPEGFIMPITMLRQHQSRRLYERAPQGLFREN